MNSKDIKEPFYKSLNESRLSKSIDLDEISNITKINIKYLEAIEQGNLDIIPPTYIRLFIKSYAQYLKLDFEKILSSYEQEVSFKSKNIFKKVSKNKVNNTTGDTRKLSDSKHSKNVPFDNEHNKLSINIKNNIINKQNSVLEEITKPNDSVNKNNDSRNLLIPKSKSKNTSLVFEEDINKAPDNLKFNLNDKYFFKPKETISSIIILIVLLSTYLLISHLSNQQVENNSNIKVDNNKLSVRSITDDSILSSVDFNDSKLKYTKSFKIHQYNMDNPYNFIITTNSKTKLNISFDKNGQRIEQCNLIAKKDTSIKLPINGNIYFDLWSAQHIEILIANESMKSYLGNDDYIVRGSFEPQDKYLRLKFYEH
tara:strand:+ start:72 stop:1178 length:1107 start_codon:yes stop_codon:yes gene_type:complete